MKAPDKIYLERDKETNKIHHLWGRDAVISSFYEHIEYIHKDALLEWLEDKVEWYEGTDIAPHYQKVIDKLNEM